MVNHPLLLNTSYLFCVPLLVALFVSTTDVAIATGACCATSLTYYSTDSRAMKLVDMVVVYSTMGFFLYDVCDRIVRQGKTRYTWVLPFGVAVVVLYVAKSHKQGNDGYHAVLHACGATGILVYLALRMGEAAGSVQSGGNPMSHSAKRPWTNRESDS